MKMKWPLECGGTVLNRRPGYTKLETLPAIDEYEDLQI